MRLNIICEALVTGRWTNGDNLKSPPPVVDARQRVKHHRVFRVATTL
jgi:hypothetical protein